jgi:hypothetical protein
VPDCFPHPSRKLGWGKQSGFFAAGRWESIAVGNHVVFDWDIPANAIGDPSRLVFSIVSPREYHHSPALPVDDDRCSFSYRVLPDS